MSIAATTLSILLAVVFLLSGARKQTASPATSAEAAHVDMSRRAYGRIGLAELAGAVGLVVGVWIVPLGVVAAAALALLMIGAAGTHVRKRDPAARVATPAVLALLAVAVVVLRLV